MQPTGSEPRRPGIGSPLETPPRHTFADHLAIIPVSVVLGCLADGMTADEILADHPTLSLKAISAALGYAVTRELTQRELRNESGAIMRALVVADLAGGEAPIPHPRLQLLAQSGVLRQDTLDLVVDGVALGMDGHWFIVRPRVVLRSGGDQQGCRPGHELVRSARCAAHFAQM